LSNHDSLGGRHGLGGDKSGGKDNGREEHRICVSTTVCLVYAVISSAVYGMKEEGSRRKGLFLMYPPDSECRGCRGLRPLQTPATGSTIDWLARRCETCFDTLSPAGWQQDE
jgi:hypothetical protein